MKRYRIAFLIICLLFTARLSAGDKITIGMILFPPDTYYDPFKKACSGKSTDIIRFILEENNVDNVIICGSAARIYQMVENGEIDVTFNIKSTRALASNVVFVEPAFRPLQLRMYTHGSLEKPGSVAAIKGFDYNGLRVSYSQKNYEFIDLPTSVSAIQLFLKNKSDHLMAYGGPMDAFMEMNRIELPDNVTFEEKFSVNTHIAINKKSDKRDMLVSLFSEYARKNNLSRFGEITLPAQNPD